MKTLAINTALPLTEVAFIEDEEAVLHESWPSNFDEAEKMLPIIKKILAKETPDQIFVVTGPGAFTGLRVGVTIANTLAFTHEAPILSVSTFDYLQNKIPEKHKDSCAIMMRAGSGVAIWLPGSQEVHRMKKDEISDFLAHHKKITHVVSDVRDEARENYPLPTSVKWLDLSKLRLMPEAVQEILTEDHPHHKLVKPYYLAPPHITKSKKQVFT